MLKPSTDGETDASPHSNMRSRSLWESNTWISEQHMHPEVDPELGPCSLQRALSRTCWRRQGAAETLACLCWASCECHQARITVYGVSKLCHSAQVCPQLIQMHGGYAWTTWQAPKNFCMGFAAGLELCCQGWGCLHYLISLHLRMHAWNTVMPFRCTSLRA